MGRRGPRPAPTALKRALGTRPDRINESEPLPSDGLPSCPEHLSSGAQAVWHRLASDLYRRGVLTNWDVEPFALYCDRLRSSAASRFDLVAIWPSGGCCKAKASSSAQTLLRRSYTSPATRCVEP